MDFSLGREARHGAVAFGIVTVSHQYLYAMKPQAYSHLFRTVSVSPNLHDWCLLNFKSYCIPKYNMTRQKFRSNATPVWIFGTHHHSDNLVWENAQLETQCSKHHRKAGVYSDRLFTVTTSLQNTK